MSLELSENIRSVSDQDQKRIIDDLQTSGLTYSDFQEKYDLSRYEAKKVVSLLNEHEYGVKKEGGVRNNPKRYMISDDAEEVNDVVQRRDDSQTKRSVTEDANQYLMELEETVKEAKKELGPLNPHLTEPLREGGQSIVLHRGDDHFGAVVQDEKGVVQFDSDIAEARVRNYFTDAISIANNREAEYDSCVLLLGGDIVTNEAIYEGQAYEIDETIDQQIARATTVYMEQIERISERFEMVKVVCQHGNHGEFRGKGQSKGANADDIIYNHLELMSHREDLENVRFVMSERANYTNFSIRGHKGHLRHGHNVKDHIGTSSPQRDWRGFLHNHDFDIAYRGHYHNHRVENVLGVPIIMAPSIMPPGSHEEELSIFGDAMSYVHGATDDNPFAWVEYINYR